MKKFRKSLSLIVMSLIIGASTFTMNPAMTYAEDTEANNTYVTDNTENTDDNTDITDNNEENDTYVAVDDVTLTTPVVTVDNVVPVTPAPEPEYNDDTDPEIINYQGSATPAAPADKVTRWLSLCDKMLRNMKKYKFKYSNNGGASTYSAGLRKGRKTNCALFVSWCLQEFGALDKGETFYMVGRHIHKKFGSWGNNVRVIRVGKKCSSVKLQKGDVVCWSSASHVNIYAGTSASGAKLWYDGGKVATAANRNGSRYVHTGKRALGYLNKRKIAYIIRLK